MTMIFDKHYVIKDGQCVCGTSGKCVVIKENASELVRLCRVCVQNASDLLLAFSRQNLVGTLVWSPIDSIKSDEAAFNKPEVPYSETHEGYGGPLYGGPLKPEPKVKCQWGNGCEKEATKGKYCDEHVKAYETKNCPICDGRGKTGQNVICPACKGKGIT